MGKMKKKRGRPPVIQDKNNFKENPVSFSVEASTLLGETIYNIRRKLEKMTIKNAGKNTRNIQKYVVQSVIEYYGLDKFNKE